MSDKFRDSHGPSLHLAESVRHTLFPSLPSFRAGRWTTKEGTDTWCLSYEDSVMYPTKMLVRSIAGPRFIQGWCVEVANDTGDGDYVEFRGWEQAVAHLISKAVDRMAKDALWQSYLSWRESRG